MPLSISSNDSPAIPARVSSASIPIRSCAACVLDLFEHSPYFAEELIRTPELLDEIGRRRRRDETARRRDASELRRWFRREMLRIQSREHLPVASDLRHAGANLGAGRRRDRARLRNRHRGSARRASAARIPPTNPSNQMWVIALGRLGMREFDLASDADLVFVLADSDARETAFLDPRRRAPGRSDHRLHRRRRAVRRRHAPASQRRRRSAGADRKRRQGIFRPRRRGLGRHHVHEVPRRGRRRRSAPNRFLHELQEVDWRRYGQSGRSRTDLRQMRLRLEKEQGAAHPLKAGRGGYYDIDFMLMYLRLKSAGIFFKVLNTPERIEVLENMGHLDRAEAQFLGGSRDVLSRARPRPPRALRPRRRQAARRKRSWKTLDALLARWTPIPLSELTAIRARTRALFDRLFG